MIDGGFEAADEYLAELERRLPARCRRRFLREAEEHLRDRTGALVAAGLTPNEAERRAVAEFGSVDELVAKIAWEDSVRATRRSSAVALAALLLLVVPLYAIPENTFGAAEWATKPAAVTVTQTVSLSLWLGALVVAAFALAAALLERPHGARVLLTAAVALSIVTACAIIVAGAVWLEHAPWTPLWSALGLVVPATAGLVGIAAGALAWMRAGRPRLDTA